MLVAISDLHFDDGTCGKSLPVDAFHNFCERLEQLAYSASMRTDGKYRPLEGIDLLLLGDIFELIYSTRWLTAKPGEPGFVRPWTDPAQPALADKILEITQAILAHNAESMAVLSQMAKGQAITLPPANAQGQPVLEKCERIPIPVHLYYMVGNHDWFFHLPGEAYSRSRQLIIDAMGLQNPSTPIAHDLHEWDALLTLFEKYRIYARHGDIYDKLCYNRDLGRDVATLGDAVSIELITRFPQEAEKDLGDDLPGNFYQGLREMINVRPNVAVPLWIGSQIRNNAITRRAESRLKKTWNGLVTEFLELNFVRSLNNKWNPFESVDKLALMLKLTRWTSIENFNKVILLIKKKLFEDDTSLIKHAFKEQAFTSHQADFIVYGHTHHHEIIPLDIYRHNGKEIDQFLVNTGTWRSYYDLTRHHPEQQKFLPFQLMSYLAFFNGDERNGRRHEGWLGKLV